MHDHDRQDTIDLLQGRLLRLTREVTDLAATVSGSGLEVANTTSAAATQGALALPAVRDSFRRGLAALTRLEEVVTDRDQTARDLQDLLPGGPR